MLLKATCYSPVFWFFKKDWQTYLKKRKTENGKFRPIIFNRFLGTERICLPFAHLSYYMLIQLFFRHANKNVCTIISSIRPAL
jgi:hypothetical protein